MYNPIFKNKQGFTLVELSIVIVVIGLIVASITAGKVLVRQAQLRVVLSEKDSFRGSINAFRLQYNGLPGDLNNAYNYWGASCAGSAGACNGNGNKKIYQGDISGRQEMFMAWKHLSLAGLVPGTYSGNSVLANSETTPGLNTPYSKFSKGEWIAESSDAWFSLDPVNSGTSVTDTLLTSKGRLTIGAHRAAAGSYNEGELFTTIEANSIDSKIDDGIPYTGKVVGLLGMNNATNCITGSGASARYTLTQSGIQCWMWFEF